MSGETEHTCKTCKYWHFPAYLGKGYPEGACAVDNDASCLASIRLATDGCYRWCALAGTKEEQPVNHDCFSCRGKGCILCDYTGHN